MSIWKIRYYELVGRCAAEARLTAQTLAKQGLNVRLWLFYLPARNGQWGDLAVAASTDPMPGYELADCCPVITGATPYDAYDSRINEKACVLPILGA